MYSRGIKCVWTAVSTPSCVLDARNASELSCFPSLAFARHRAAGLPHEGAFEALKADNCIFASNCYTAIADYAGLAYSTGVNSSVSRFAFKFLAGHTIQNGAPIVDPGDQETRFSRFVEQVGRLGGTGRTATKPHDYVVSVWVDCPGYILPVEYRNMGLPLLLENAVRQFEALSKRSIPVNLPSDLTSNASTSSALWRPTSYLSTQRISSVDSIYGVLSQPFRLVPINDSGQIPLKIFYGNTVAIGSRTGEYPEVFHDQDASQVFDNMLRIVHCWPLSVLERLVSHNLMSSALADPSNMLQVSELDFLCNLFQSALLDSVMRKWNRPGSARSWQGKPNIDHHEAVYGLVTKALNLNKETCKRYGLRLLVSFQDPPIIGLTNRDPHDFHELNDADRLYRLDPRRTITVCISRGTQNTGDVLHDAVKVSDDVKSTYRVTTIWVPQHNTPFHDIGAVVDPDGSDGFLGTR